MTIAFPRLALMSVIALALTRLLTAGWVGAACGFVIILVGLRRSPLFDSAVKLVHPRVLFPLYYTGEFVLISAALVCACAAWGSPHASRRGLGTGVACLALALGAAAGDYFWVYRPLADMLGQPELPASFEGLHRASLGINMAIVLLSLTAAIGVQLPPTRTDSPC